MTHLADESSIGSVPQIDGSVFGWRIASHGFGSFEGVNVVFKNSHNFIFIEVRNPVKEGEEKPFGIAVEFFADAVDGDVIIDEFNFIFVAFKRVNQKLLLISSLRYFYPSNECIYPESKQM